MIADRDRHLGDIKANVIVRLRTLSGPFTLPVDGPRGEPVRKMLTGI